MYDQVYTERRYHFTDVEEKNKGDHEQLVSVLGLQWCHSTFEYESKFNVNRDLNAAINILGCATLPIRPTWTGIFDKVVGKRI